eukprot:COSAG04_NODE_13118_length_619_cov_1.275000_1_plen_33_part_10
MAAQLEECRIQAVKGRRRTNFGPELGAEKKSSE